jgi:hypothetical protein
VPFSYYGRLSAAQQAVYRRSDAVTAVRLRGPEALRPLAAELAASLDRDDRAATASVCGRLVAAIAADLGVPSAQVQVLAVRPTLRWGELHGLYTNDGPPRIQVWMRTARHRRVVAFRTFLRTLLHELCHHLDYVQLRLADSYHTEGFFKRESSLFHQLVPRDAAPPGGP